MKNRARFLVLLALALAAAAVTAGTRVPQDIQHVTTAVNIEVPVRVFKDGAFVDDLALSDFEVLEDGRPQSLDAVYLVKKKLIERREETDAVLAL